MNTCIEHTTAVYMHRVWNLAEFKPKCKTDFLPWFHHSKFFMQTKYNFRGKSQVFKEINCYNNYDRINKTVNNILFTHYFKTANTKLLPCGLRSDEVKQLVQILRIQWHCSQEKLFSCSVWPNTWWTCVLIKYMHWNGQEKSHHRAWLLPGLLKTTSQPCCFNRLQILRGLQSSQCVVLAGSSYARS